MVSITDLLQQGATNLWLFIPSAMLLGALYGLEPGHSKTMLAAFIIAVRGAVAQAVLLDLSASISHTAVVWVVALAGQYFGREWGTETTSPIFSSSRAALIISIALWMIWRTCASRTSSPTITTITTGNEVRRINARHGISAR